MSKSFLLRENGHAWFRCGDRPADSAFFKLNFVSSKLMAVKNSEIYLDGLVAKWQFTGKLIGRVFIGFELVEASEQLIIKMVYLSRRSSHQPLNTTSI